MGILENIRQTIHNLIPFQKQQPANQREEIIQKFSEEYYYTNEEGTTLLKVEKILKDLNTYYTCDKIDSAIFDFGSNGGIFFFQDPEASPAYTVQTDLVRAFLSATQEASTIPGDVIEDEVPEMNPETVSQYIEDGFEQIQGGGVWLQDSLFEEYQRILEQRDFNKKSSAQDEAQTTL